MVSLINLLHLDQDQEVSAILKKLQKSRALTEDCLRRLSLILEYVDKYPLGFCTNDLARREELAFVVLNHNERLLKEYLQLGDEAFAETHLADWLYLELAYGLSDLAVAEAARENGLGEAVARRIAYRLVLKTRDQAAALEGNLRRSPNFDLGLPALGRDVEREA